MTERSLTLNINADGDEPPTGLVVSDGAQPIAFSGWLDLMTTLESIVTGSRTAVGSVDATGSELVGRLAPAEAIG